MEKLNKNIEPYQNLDINDMKGEIWKVIDKHPSYSISNLGRIKLYRNFNGSYILKQTIRNNYLYVIITKKTIRNNYRIHRLVASLFIRNLNNFPCVNHKDGNKKNNKISNLEWCTYSQNMLHAYKIGLKLSTNGNKVQAIKMNTGEVFEFNSVYAASRYVKGQQPNVYMCCIGKRKTHKGYSFNFIQSNIN
jgi:hypothetical protein